MAIIDLNDLLDDVHYVYNSLKEVIVQVTRKLQLKADSEAEDPNADNSNLPITLPYQYYATHYTAFPAKTVTHDYDAYTSGNHKVAFTYQLILNDNVLTMSGLTAIGMVEGSGWHLLSPEQREVSYNQIKNYYEGQPIHIISNFPERSTTFSHTSGFFQFFPTGKQSSDIYYKYQTLSGDTVSGGIATSMYSAEYTPYIDDSTGYLYNAGNFNQLNSGQTSYIQRQPFEGVFGNLASARAWVNANDATHNYEREYLVYGGTMTVLYGDNYIIYVVPSGVKVTYNLMKNITQNVANTINSDNPTAPQIIVPTYDENKHGGHVDETDANHTKPMVLNKFVPDANGMVYYYELDKDDVWKVRAGLNTINLDPLVLKDVTRNLISYKIFAFDPATLIKTKTPVIVHIGGREIKYNDASIPANYVEELKTIALGSINIGKLFGDYRDYAPYTKIELFVPFCGWTTLPSWCIDTTITGEMFVDMWNGSCKAVIKASAIDSPDGVVVCEMGGVCAYDVPFVADATGAKAASLLSKVATTAGAVATGNPLAIATSGISLATALNENYTRMMGVVGDGSNINGLDHMFVKLTRVSWTDPNKKERPDAYKRMHGIPCGKQLTLAEGDGFTQINDANITGTMTDREKQMIIDGFRHGLIL